MANATKENTGKVMRVVLRRTKRFGSAYGPRRVLILESPPYPSRGLRVWLDGEDWAVTAVEETTVVARIPFPARKTTGLT